MGRCTAGRHGQGARGALTVRSVIAGALLVLSPAAVACGYCVEDKIAGVYDHAVVERALGAGHSIAFFHIDGTIVPGEGTRRLLETLANTAAGVDKGSARVSIESQAVSVAYDPRRAPFGSVHRALEKKFGVKNLRLMPLKVMEQPAELTAVRKY